VPERQRSTTPYGAGFEFAWGMVFVSNHWHNSAVTWTLTGLGAAPTSAQGVLVMRRHRAREGG